MAVLKLRMAAPADAEIGCRLWNAHDPDEPQDPDVLRHRWSLDSPDWVRERFIVERDGEPVGFALRGHLWWRRPDDRWAFNDLRLRPEDRRPELANEVYDRLEAANVEEGAQSLAARTKEGFDWEIALLEGRGYRFDRLAKAWELDLIAHRDRLLAQRESGRAAMRREPVRTDNDEQSAPMLHINQELGYHRVPGFLSYIKAIG